MARLFGYLAAGDIAAGQRHGSDARIGNNATNPLGTDEDCTKKILRESRLAKDLLNLKRAARNMYLGDWDRPL